LFPEVVHGSDAEPIPVEHMDEDELRDLHDRIAFTGRMQGLQGQALDEAIASAFAAVVRAVEQSRASYDNRRSSLRVVE
jgi:hypothetical protein